MNLLDWKGWLPSSRQALSRGWRDGWMGGLGSDHGSVPASYGERVRAAYGANPLAQRACRLVAGAVGDAPLGIDGVAAMAARIGALIGARSGGVALLETVALHLVLHGNAYVQLLDAGDGALGALYALRPDKVVVELGADGWPVGYAYGVGAERRLIPAEDAHGRPALVHLRSGHPLDDHYGMGCLDAAIGAVVLHNEASRWNRGLIANAARPSGALVHDPAERGATLTAAQFERLKAEMAEQFQGAGNAGRPMLLDGGLKWQSLSLSPAEMDFAALKDGAAREIACAFGVPPVLLGLSGDATYANYREAMKALWRNTVLPLAGTILSGLSGALAEHGLAARIAVDLDRVPALAEDRAALWAMASAADFLSGDEKKALVGWGAKL